MSKVGIVTDTSNSLPREMVKEYDIFSIPVGFRIEQKSI